MSEVEAHIGKLIPIDRQGKTVEEWVKDTLGITEKPDYETWLSHYDEVCWDHPKKYVDVYYHKPTDTLYEIRSTKFDPESMLSSHTNADGSIEFTVSFYNGGASLNEILDDVMEAETSS